MTELDAMMACLREFEGETVWRPVAGAGTGTFVSVNFGEPVRRDRPLSNPALDDINRNFDAEHSIYVENAPWALYGRQGLICSSDTPQSIFVEQLAQMAGKVVGSISVDQRSLALSVSMSEEMRFEVYGEHRDPEAGGAFYSVFTAESVFVAASDGLTQK